MGHAITTLRVLCFAAFLLYCGATSAQTTPILSIDFSGTEIQIPEQPGTDTPLQPGYVGWAGPYLGDPGADYNETRSFAADFGIGGVVDVTVRSEGLFFRDYSPLVGGPFLDQSALLSDSILRNRPGSIFLSFDSLTDGVYAMKSFHHDTGSIDTFVPFNIILTDGLVTSQTLFSGLDTTQGTSPTTVTIVDYTFTVVGGSTVVIEFAGEAQSNQHMSINGFQLQRIGDVPPPNHPPSANAGPDQTIECNAHGGTGLVLDGTASQDPDNDPLTYTWTGPFGTTSGMTAIVSLPLGTHSITLTVDDGHGGSATDTVEVTVEDTTPPVISTVTASPNTLWPPNHKMVPVSVSAAVADACDAAPSCQILSVTSNEPGESDWTITGPMSVDLRAERQGKGSGRVYTIMVQCTDHSGNTSTRDVHVTVAHDSNGGGMK